MQNTKLVIAAYAAGIVTAVLVINAGMILHPLSIMATAVLIAVCTWSYLRLRRKCDEQAH